MGTIRLGKRTDNKNPLIKDFVSLANLDDIVFGGWDLFKDNAYQAALKAGVLDKQQIEQFKSELSAIKPMKAVFDPTYIRNLDATNIKSAPTKMGLALELINDIERFKKENNCLDISVKLTPHFGDIDPLNCCFEKERL